MLHCFGGLLAHFGSKKKAKPSTKSTVQTVDTSGIPTDGGKNIRNPGRTYNKRNKTVDLFSSIGLIGIIYFIIKILYSILNFIIKIIM